MADAVEKPKRVYGKRFLLANLLVVAGFASVIVLFAFLVSNNAAKTPWSDYKPKGGDPFEKAQNMVDHVTPKYRYGGAPIAIVQAQPLLFRDQIVDGVAVVRPPIRQVGQRQFPDFEPSGSTITYVFCGQAEKCALSPSTASEVIPLLQRESLELALYTFKYWPDVRSIVTLLPTDQQGSAAVFLRRSHVKKFLDKPLAATLPPHGQLTAQSLTDAERATIDRVVVKNTFASRFEQVPNGRTLLMLTEVQQ